jgi:hypothetical protein
MSGTSGKGLRLEANKINLTGAAGFGYRLEGIRIVILSKNDPAPGAIERPFVQK